MTGPSSLRELPPYRAVLAVDVKNFSGVKGADHHELTEIIPVVLERAFERAGYRSAWDERRFPAGRGDGFVVGFRTEVLPILIGPVVDCLQDELAYQHRIRPRSAPDGPRMRVSIGVGPLTDSDENRFADGSGEAMVETHRLLDSEPVRRLLEDSDPEVTFVALVMSARVYEDVVAAGYSNKLPAEFIAVGVKVKTYQGTAFLHVPKPSGTLLERGLGEPPKEMPTDPGTPPSAEVANTVAGHVSGNVLQSRDLFVGERLILGDTHKHTRH